MKVVMLKQRWSDGEKFERKKQVMVNDGETSKTKSYRAYCMAQEEVSDLG